MTLGVVGGKYSFLTVVGTSGTITTKSFSSDGKGMSGTGYLYPVGAGGAGGRGVVGGVVAA